MSYNQYFNNIGVSHPNLGVWDPNTIRWWVVPQTTTTSGTDHWAGVFGPQPTVVAIENPVTVVEAEPAKPKKDPFDPRNWGL